MDIKLIIEGKATIEDLEQLAGLGYEFPCGNGKVTDIIMPDVRRCNG